MTFTNNKRNRRNFKMIRCGVLDSSKGSRRGQSPSAVVILALLMALTLPARAQRACVGIDCSKICDASITSGSYMPQRCDECCRHIENDEDEKDDNGVDERLEAMEDQIKELKVLIGVVLAMVVLLILAVVVLFFRHTSTRAIKAALPVFFKRKDGGRSSIEKQKPQYTKEVPAANTTTKVPNANRNSTVVRIADYQNNHSPLAKRMQLNGQTIQDSTLEPNFPPSSELPRTRQPSESTCPDESTDLPHGHQHAYDNLALSTSTLHNTTTSSTSTLGPAVSTNTLDTTLPSINQTTSVLG